MTHEELNRLDDLLHRVPMKKLRKLSNDLHKECDRKTLVVMIMDLEFCNDPLEPDQIDGILHNLRGVETVSMVP